ncbi:NUDIX hydrolase [Frigidibacter sp.]|uniref:NUDIX hydrolase n=1 Tax=Frigidibacter sp. TaxID=2586418 RepID=UPI002736A6CB|nr:NUDIX hydrolase [Frigidibacter sp.]MDP3339865.1 NUDIX hydrolase [Frigidibacter sp.]
MRIKVRAELQSIEPLDAIEEQQIRSSIDWIDSGAELIRRRKPATPPRHLVSYFALIDGDWILLVDHINAKLWLPPGGHVEAGETPRQTVEREVHEELGIPADFLVPYPIFLTVTETVGLTAGHVDVSLWFVLKGCRGQPLDFDHSEFHEVRWFHRDALPLDRMEPNLLRFMGKLDKSYRAGQASLRR